MTDDGGAVLIVDSDLFFTVKIADALKHAGYVSVTVRRVDDCAAAVATHRPVAALLNTAARGLDWRAALAELSAAGVPAIAYGAHVDVETQEQARQAGAAIVVAN